MRDISSKGAEGGKNIDSQINKSIYKQMLSDLEVNAINPDDFDKKY